MTFSTRTTIINENKKLKVIDALVFQEKDISGLNKKHNMNLLNKIILVSAKSQSRNIFEDSRQIINLALRSQFKFEGLKHHFKAAVD